MQDSRGKHNERSSASDCALIISQSETLESRSLSGLMTTAAFQSGHET